MSTELYLDIKDSQWPIIYRNEYNIYFFGLEGLHHSDARKWGNIFEYLKQFGVINDASVVCPNLAKTVDLTVVHPKTYLWKLKLSIYVAQIAEVPILMLVPNFIVQRGFLRPMRYQTGGSILAGKLALERGWAINLGGGFHHCSRNKGAGFCAYADIQLLIQYLFQYFHDKVKSVMIVDLDAHQGNGYQRDFLNDSRIFIIDIYNSYIYPNDLKAKEAIDVDVKVSHKTTDEEYIDILHRFLRESVKRCRPDVIVYNAGIDILHKDPLGHMHISPEGVQMRDEMVFQCAFDSKIPIVMLLSGGYLKKSAKYVACSIRNLKEKGLIYGQSQQ